jgi:hypothetical protein
MARWDLGKWYAETMLQNSFGLRVTCSDTPGLWLGLKNRVWVDASIFANYAIHYKQATTHNHRISNPGRV